jgi:hypothetical protein
MILSSAETTVRPRQKMAVAIRFLTSRKSDVQVVEAFRRALSMLDR